LKKLKVDDAEAEGSEDLEVEMDHLEVVNDVIFAIIVTKKDTMLKTAKNLLKEESQEAKMEGVSFVMKKVIKR